MLFVYQEVESAENRHVVSWLQQTVLVHGSVKPLGAPSNVQHYEVPILRNLVRVTTREREREGKTERKKDRTKEREKIRT